jgi:histidinol-phosphate aminotransferase
MRPGISRRTLLAGALMGGTALRALAGGHAATGGLLRLIANENPYGPSPAAREAANRAVQAGWKYAMREVTALKGRIAAHEGVSPAHIMVSAGSTEALRVSALAFLRAGGRVLAAQPTFAFFADYARALDCEVDAIPLTAAKAHDLDAMAAAVKPDTRAVYLCNPNNPTGTRLPIADLEDFIAAVAPRAPVIVDEAYLDLDPDWPGQTAVARVRAGDAVIVTRTFSKLHGMAGLRVGYAVAPPAIIDRLEALRITQMSYPGVMAAAASLDDEEFINFSRARIREGVAIVTGVLQALRRPYISSYGNFVFFDTGAPAREFMAGMRQRGILTGMPSGSYPTWARVSVGKVEEMQAFATAARDYFGGKG